MKVRITEMGAPWPQGLGVGDVVDLGDRSEVPPYFLGKCEQTDDEPTTKPEAKEDAEGGEGGEETGDVAPDLSALKAEAEGLGIAVHHLWKAPRLMAEIAKAKGEQ